MKSRLLPQQTFRLTALLAALTILGPFGTDAYLPAFAAIGRELNASAWQVQQTISLYMATFAFMALWHGALSDSFGRRRVMLAATVVFAASSVLCACAPSISWLWLGRGLQGLAGGAGMIVARAVVRDLFEGPQAQRQMSRLMMLFALAPAIAPVLGGYLLVHLGWRSIFWTLALLAFALSLLTWFYLPETLAPEERQSVRPRALFAVWREMFSSPPFLLLAVGFGATFSGLFLYIVSAPVLLLQHLQWQETQFGWFFIPLISGMALGSLVSGQMAGRYSLLRTAQGGLAIMFLSVVLNIAGALLFASGALVSIAPVVLYAFGAALAMPSMSLLGLEIFPRRRGAASSFQSFVQALMSVVASGLIAPWVNVCPRSMTFALAAFFALALIAFGGWQWRYQNKT